MAGLQERSTQDQKQREAVEAEVQQLRKEGRKAESSQQALQQKCHKIEEQKVGLEYRLQEAVDACKVTCLGRHDKCST